MQVSKKHVIFCPLCGHMAEPFEGQWSKCTECKTQFFVCRPALRDLPREGGCKHRRECKNKLSYPTLEEALNHARKLEALPNKPLERLSIYKCRFPWESEHWHIGHVPITSKVRNNEWYLVKDLLEGRRVVPVVQLNRTGVS